MPNASLLVMTSPLLLGSGPLAPAQSAAMTEVANAAPIAVAIEASLPQLHRPPQRVMLLDWSLAEVQEPPRAEGEGQSAPVEQSEEGEPEIVVEGEYGPPAGDPLGAINQTTFEVTQRLDSVFVEPVADVYREALPDPLRMGIGNFVRNLREPANFLNYLLQFKIGDAAETLARFAINSTLGIGGIFDVAATDPINLPYRQNGFANTLGYYGVGNDGYLYLPITGPTTLRDLIGNSLDQALLPTLIGRPYTSPEFAIPLFVVANLDSRVEIDEELERIGETVDPYATRRDVYLWRRERDIALLKGEEPPPRPEIVREIEEGVDFDDEEDEFIGDAPPVMQEGWSVSYSQRLRVPELAPQQLASVVAITVPQTR